MIRPSARGYRYQHDMSERDANSMRYARAVHLILVISRLIQIQLELPLDCICSRVVNMDNSVSYMHAVQSSSHVHCTISDMLLMWAKGNPEKEAFVFVSPNGDRLSLTFLGVYREAHKFAFILHGLGIRRGDLVGVSVSDSAAWVACEFGIILAGACACNIAFTMTDGSDVLQTLIQLETCKVLIVDRGDTTIKWDICKKLFGLSKSVNNLEIPMLDHIIAVGSCEEESFLKYDELMKGVVDVDYIIPRGSPEDGAVGLQTSGSTSAPKMARHSHFSIINWGIRYAKICGNVLKDNTVYYASRSMSCGGGFPFLLIACGTTLVTQFVKCDEKRIPVNKIIDVLDNESCTITLFLPQDIREIYRSSNQRRFRSLKLIATGGQPITKEVLKEGMSLAEKVLVLYGSTECGFASSIMLDSPDFSSDSLAGFPSEGYEIKVTDDNGVAVQRTLRGTVHIRATGIFSDYVNDKHATENVQTKTGWFMTDDNGYMNIDGCLFVEGRQSDVIVCGGMNIVPTVLESIVKECPGVADVMIVPVPDQDMHEEICACIVPSPDARMNAKIVKSFCMEKMLYRASVSTRLPKYYVFIDSFPVTKYGNMKISRKLLQTIAIEEIQKGYRLTL